MKSKTGLALLMLSTLSLNASADLLNLKKMLEESVKAVTEQSKPNQLPDAQQPSQEVPQQEPSNVPSVPNSNQQAVTSPVPSVNAEVQHPKITQPTPPVSASNNNVREKWLSDPYPDIPSEVTDKDIRDVTRESLNKIYGFLKSPVMSKAYKVCQEKEETRIGKKAIDIKQAANNAKTTPEKSELLSQAKTIESIKSKVSSSSCLLRTIRRATIDLNLEYYSTQPKYGPPKSNDEQFNVTQIFKVAKALETNQFTNKFNSLLSKELSINYDDWYQKYIISPYTSGVDELKKSTNSIREKSEFDQGLNFAITRKAQFYDEIIGTIEANIISGNLTP